MHTKLPWTQEQAMTVDGLPVPMRYEIWGDDDGDDAGPGVVAECWNKDNAEFIERACNSHKDLLEACKELLIRLAGNQCVSVDELCEETSYGRQARDAIAKAEGGAK